MGTAMFMFGYLTAMERLAFCLSLILLIMESTIIILTIKQEISMEMAKLI